MVRACMLSWISSDGTATGDSWSSVRNLNWAVSSSTISEKSVEGTEGSTTNGALADSWISVKKWDTVGSSSRRCEKSAIGTEGTANFMGVRVNYCAANT